MINLSNGHSFEYMVASGALGFDGQGWFWEKPLVRLGLIQPDLFTVVIKTLTLYPRAGNYRRWKPLQSFRFIPGGSVNKIGLTNKGFDWWRKKVGPHLDFERYHIVGSIYGTREELVEMAKGFNHFNLVGLEVNSSCPNTGHGMPSTAEVVDGVKSVKAVSRHPIIVKVSVAQDYLRIAQELADVAEAIALNSVPWEMVFPMERSPLWRLQERVGGGGGGVSGKPAQAFNWPAVERLVKDGTLPVIGPNVMELEDLRRVRKFGARAISFGAIHLRTPWAPTAFVREENP